MNRPTHVKRYAGETQQEVLAAFQQDAVDAARYGWVPVAQRWAPGSLEVTYQSQQPLPTGQPWPDWRLATDARLATVGRRGRASGSVGKATLLAACIGAVGGLASLVLVMRIVPDWHLVSGLNDFIVAWFWASFVCWLIAVVVAIRWQRLDGCGTWLLVGLVGSYLALMLEFTTGLMLLSLLAS